jgi:hypothetical protein
LAFPASVEACQVLRPNSGLLIRADKNQVGARGCVPWQVAEGIGIQKVKPDPKEKSQA